MPEESARRGGGRRCRSSLTSANVCAHDDRLYCAHTGKSRDKRFADMLAALELIVRDSDMSLYRESLHRTLALFDSVPTITREVIDEMGGEP